jgi:site-specific DNA-adenine methylase
MALIQPGIVNWYGGKFALARQIVSVMPEHDHYVEVFMGSAAVFFNKPKATLNVLNDLNGNLVNLFIQTRDNFDELAEKIYWTLYSRDQYNIFKKQLEDSSIYKMSDIDRAVAYYVIVRSSFSGGVEFGFKPTGHTWRFL